MTQGERRNGTSSFVLMVIIIRIDPHTQSMVKVSAAKVPVKATINSPDEALLVQDPRGN